MTDHEKKLLLALAALVIVSPNAFSHEDRTEIRKILQKVFSEMERPEAAR